MSFCSLIKAIIPKIRILCFVLINSVILNLLCVRILIAAFGAVTTFSSLIISPFRVSDDAHVAMCTGNYTCEQIINNSS